MEPLELGRVSATVHQVSRHKLMRLLVMGEVLLIPMLHRLWVVLAEDNGEQILRVRVLLHRGMTVAQVSALAVVAEVEVLGRLEAMRLRQMVLLVVLVLICPLGWVNQQVQLTRLVAEVAVAILAPLVVLVVVEQVGTILLLGLLGPRTLVAVEVVAVTTTVLVALAVQALCM